MIWSSSSSCVLLQPSTRDSGSYLEDLFEWNHKCTRFFYATCLQFSSVVLSVSLPTSLWQILIGLKQKRTSGAQKNKWRKKCLSFTVYVDVVYHLLSVKYCLCLNKSVYQLLFSSLYIFNTIYRLHRFYLPLEGIVQKRSLKNVV